MARKIAKSKAKKIFNSTARKTRAMNINPKMGRVTRL